MNSTHIKICSNAKERAKNNHDSGIAIQVEQQKRNSIKIEGKNNHGGL